MMRRLFWASLGLGAGAVIGAGVMRWANQTREALRPRSVVGNLADTAADWREWFAEALEAGRAAMAEREEELHARYDGFEAGQRARARRGVDG
jgi:hypothetical protein